MKKQAENSKQSPEKRGLSYWLKDQFALAPLIGDYFIPGETNNLWYSLGGILAFALLMQGISGIILAFKYIPDAARAYGIMSDMIQSGWWSAIVAFHYYNSFLIIILTLAHLLRVFFSAAYRNGKKALWLVGVVLYATILSLYVTGESLHWDEVGFAVPWHMSEFFQAIHLNNALQYNFSDLLAPASATTKLTQIFALHISVLPLLLLILIPLHLFLIRMKGISAPFWKIASGQQVSFSRHIKVWLIAGGIATIAVFLIAIVIGRDAGTAPQLLSSSPLYEAHKGPGALGFKPSWPIGWTHGMNVFVAKMGLEPDIWGTVITLLLFFTLLLLVPFIDRMDKEPATITEAFDWRRRYGAFILIALFLIVMFTGMIINALAGPG